MRHLRLCLAFLSFLALLVSVAAAQVRRPGLYETTTDVNWVQSPFPPGMKMPGGARSPFGNQHSVHQSCVTQEEIDRYGAILPEPQGECRLTSVSRGARGLSATLLCSGRMQGQGTVVASWTPEGEGRAKVHFTGSVQFGDDSHPVEFISVYNYVYKGASCGDVEPTPLPPD